MASRIAARSGGVDGRERADGRGVVRKALWVGVVGWVAGLALVSAAVAAGEKPRPGFYEGVECRLDGCELSTHARELMHSFCAMKLQVPGLAWDQVPPSYGAHRFICFKRGYIDEIHAFYQGEQLLGVRALRKDHTGTGFRLICDHPSESLCAEGDWENATTVVGVVHERERGFAWYYKAHWFAY